VNPREADAAVADAIGLALALTFYAILLYQLVYG
jgi:hypothetical protein